MKKRFNAVVFCLILLSEAKFPLQVIGGNNPVILPIPMKVNGVANPVISLNGTWKFTLNPPVQFWKNTIIPETWDNIKVPGEPLMQGFNIKSDIEYPYKKEIVIPKDFAGKRIFLQFDGVYSYARVWVNGIFICDHNGGFTSWNCEITAKVTPGETAWLTIGVTDRSDDISWGSNYAHHNIGGILWDVRLIAVPADPLTRLYTEIRFDSTFTNASLLVGASVDFSGTQEVTIVLTLENREKNKVELSPGFIHLTPEKPEAIIPFLVKNPRKWDAEHPNIYTMTASVKTGEKVTEVVPVEIGFREIQRKGNKVYVNGMPVTLRGVNRHMAHPLLGRAITADLDWQDVRLYKEANVNFIRTSHYPPSRSFLKACDHIGIYVEEESAVAFTVENTSQNPDYTSRYLGQFTEMVERDRNRACILLWSLGNESFWGINFQKCYDYAKREDPGHLVVFNHPTTVPVGINCYDVFDEHYYNSVMNMSQSSILYPVLHGEFAHVGGNYKELQRDPGVNDYWGIVLRRYSENFFSTDGCLGGAIWGSIDDVFCVPDINIEHPVIQGGRNSEFGFGEWGCLIDGWRRPKPQYWNTKKAYSPIRLQSNWTKMNFEADYGLLPLRSPGADKPIAIPVENQFDHTNLKELKIEWTVNGQNGKITDLDIAPGCQGELIIPPRKWKKGESVQIRFYQYDTLLVDIFEFPIGQAVKEFFPMAASGFGPTVSETPDGNILIKGSNSGFIFSGKTGLIVDGNYKGKTLITGGPYLNLTGGEELLPNEWVKESFSVKEIKRSNIAVITLSGKYRDVGVAYEITIDGEGLMETKYRITRVPQDQPQDGYEEVGLEYELTDEINRLTWDRDGLWDVYPDNHIARICGEAFRERAGGQEQFGEKPGWPWSQDMKEYFLFGRNDRGGRGTRDFRSMKTDIWFASAIRSNGNERVRVESNRYPSEYSVREQHAVRLSVQQETKHVLLHINNEWNYPNVCYIKYKPPVWLRSSQERTVRIRLTNTDEYDKITYLN